MKKTIFLFFAFVYFNSYAQKNEFANEKFYTAFNKIQPDAMNGFALYKGSKIVTEFDILIEKFKTRILLPGADSGFIYNVAFGDILAAYYYKPLKTEAEVAQLSSRLKEAIQNATKKVLYEEKEFREDVNNKGYTLGYFFKPNHSVLVNNAEVRMDIYEEKKMFRLELIIRGRLPQKSALKPENNLGEKLLKFFNDASSCFSSLKGNVIPGYDEKATFYESKETLFGIKGEIIEKYDCELKYEIKFTELSGLNEAKKIYDEIKNALVLKLSNKIIFGAEGQNPFILERFGMQGTDKGSDVFTNKNEILILITRSEYVPSITLIFRWKKK